jgi:hypothetical protein
MLALFVYDTRVAEEEVKLFGKRYFTGFVTISLPGETKVKSATPVNLRGEATGKKLEVKENAISIYLGAFGPPALF